MRSAMRAFLATVLSLIAGGVLLIAYGLLGPRAVAAPASPYAAAAAPLASFGGAAPTVPYAVDARGTVYQPVAPMPVSDVVALRDQAAYDRYYAPQPTPGYA